MSEQHTLLAPKRRTLRCCHGVQVLHLVLLRRLLAIGLLRVAALTLTVGALLLPVLLRRVALVVPLRRPAGKACTRVNSSGCESRFSELLAQMRQRGISTGGDPEST